MKTFLNIIFFLLIVCPCNAQQEIPFLIHNNAIAANNDQSFVDSLKRIIKKGINFEIHNKQNKAAQLRYINACISLAKYYEQKFDSGELKTMKQAIRYYEKLTDIYWEMGVFDRDQKSEGVSMIAAISRKLSTIYFKGKGVKKDVQASMNYALYGVGYNHEFSRFYSLRYFNTEDVFLKMEEAYDEKMCPIFFVYLNPFNNYGFAFSKHDKLFLGNMAGKYFSSAVPNHLPMGIVTYPDYSLKSEGNMHTLYWRMKDYFSEKMNLTEENIWYDEQRKDRTTPEYINGQKVYFLEIRFAKQE